MPKFQQGKSFCNKRRSPGMALYYLPDLRNDFSGMREEQFLPICHKFNKVELSV